MRQTSLAIWSQNLTLALILAGLVAMAVYTGYYKLKNPFLQVQRKVPAQEQSRQKAMAMISMLMQKLEENPNQVRVIRSLAQVFMDLENWDRAAKFWQRLVNMDEDDLSSRQSLALCYYNAGDFKRAAEELKKVLKRSQKEYFAHYNLAIIYAYYLEKKDKAREHLKFLTENLEKDSDLRIKANEELQRIGP